MTVVITVRREGSLLIPNTLADLTRRECRFMHNPNGITNGSGFPYAATTGPTGTACSSPMDRDPLRARLGGTTAGNTV